MNYVEITEMMNSYCKHYKTYYGQPKGNTYVCTKVNNSIKKLLDKNIYASKSIIEDYLTYMTKGSKKGGYNYYNYQTCYGSNGCKEFEEIAKKLIANCYTNITAATFKLILDKNLFELFDVVMDKKKYAITISNIKYKFRNFSPERVIKLFNYFGETEKNEIIEYCIGNKYIRFINEIFKIHPFQKKYLVAMCKIKGFNIDTYIGKNNINLDEECLESACQNYNTEVIAKILNNKIIPTGKAFKYLISNFCNDFNNKKNITKCINNFINCGYQLKKEDILTLIEKKYTVANLDLYDIKLDHDILKHCYDYNYLDNEYNFSNFDGTIELLRLMCTKEDLNAIKKFYENNVTIVPDEQCMLNACIYSKKREIILFLIEKGGMFNYNLLRQHLQATTFPKNLIELCDVYNSYLENKINNMEKLLKDNDIKYKPLTKMKNNNAKIKTNKPIMKLIPIESNSEKEIDNTDILKIKLIVRKKNVIPTNKNFKIKVPKKLSKFFEIDKTELMSFNESKNYMIDKIIKNKWFNKNKPNLIDFPSNFRKILKLPKDGYVTFNDLGNIIEQCYY